MLELRDLLGPYVKPSRPALPGTPLVVRLAMYIDYQGDDACWEWMGARDQDGYGKIMMRPRLRSVHRVVWEYFNGPIQHEQTVDHECHNRAVRLGLCKGGPSCPHRACCNALPGHSHLAVCTAVENTLRGNTAAVINAAKTHCIHGHAFDEANTRVTRGERVCRACQRGNSARWKAKASH